MSEQEIKASLQELTDFCKANFTQIFRQLRKLENLEAYLVSTLNEILTGLDEQGTIIATIADAQAQGTVEIKAYVEMILAGGTPTQQQSQAILETVNRQKTQLLGIRDAAVQLAPGIKNPEQPTTEPGVPIPEPIPAPPDVQPGDVVVEETPDEIGLPGTIEISVPENSENL